MFKPGLRLIVTNEADNKSLRSRSCVFVRFFEAKAVIRLIVAGFHGYGESLSEYLVDPKHIVVR